MSQSFNRQLYETHQRLQDWGSWCQAIVSMGLGYARKSVIAQLQENRGVLTGSTSSQLAPMHPEAEEIDDFINLLGKSEPKVARVLCLHYVTEGASKEKIQRSGLPRATYFYYLSNAENWLSQQLYPSK